MEQLISAAKEFGALVGVVVTVAFTIYNTIVSNYNNRTLVEHRRALDNLQLQTPPPK